MYIFTRGMRIQNSLALSAKFSAPRNDVRSASRGSSLAEIANNDAGETDKESQFFLEPADESPIKEALNEDLPMGEEGTNWSIQKDTLAERKPLITAAMRTPSPKLMTALDRFSEELRNPTTSWERCLEAFASISLNRNLGMTTLPIGVIRHLTHRLLEHDVAARHYGGDFSKLLDAVKAESGARNSRWEPTQAEVMMFVDYKSRAGHRHVLNDALFVARPSQGAICGEGRDDQIIRRIMRPLMVTHHEQGASKRTRLPGRMIAELMNLSIRWTTALQLLHSAKIMHHPILPLQELYTRTMSLMVRYDYSGEVAASRPWEKALEVYTEACSAHPPDTEIVTAAIDALACSLSPKKRTHQAAAHVAMVWSSCLNLLAQDAVQVAPLRGEEGVNLCESVLRLSASMGNWRLALTTLSQLDLGRIPSHRLLVPTAEAVALAIATCLQSGMLAHATQLTAYFEHDFHYHQLPVDILTHLLSVLPVHPHCNDVVARIITRGKRLAPKVALACLGALARSQSPKDDAIAEYVTKCVDHYFHGVWDPDAATRNRRLSRLFRFVYEASMRHGSNQGVMIDYTRRCVERFAGQASHEMLLFKQAEVATIPYVSTWEKAVEVYTRVVLPLAMPSGRDAMQLTDAQRRIIQELPYSIGSLRQMLVFALYSFSIRGVSYGRANPSSHSQAMEAEPDMSEEEEEVMKPVVLRAEATLSFLSWERALQLSQAVYKSKFDAVPHRLLCHIIAGSHSPEQRQRFSTPSTGVDEGGTASSSSALSPKAAAFLGHLSMTPVKKLVFAYEENLMRRWDGVVPWSDFLAAELDLPLDNVKHLLGEGKVQLYRTMLGNRSKDQDKR